MAEDNEVRVTVAQAREMLGTTPHKIAKLIADGELRTEINPLDGRSKTVLLADVVRLMKRAGIKKEAA